MSQHEPIVPVPDNKATQHDGARHLAINNSWRYRDFTLLALQSTARFYRCNGPCVPISKHLMVKIGPFVHLTEAATLKIVADKTSIPVPHVYCSLAHKNQAFILMERIRGQTLAEVWDGLSDTERESVLTQLKRMTGDLRAIPSPPGTGIESCVGGSLRDSRIPRCRPRMGPFKTVQVFHFWLRDYLRLEEHGTRQGDGDWQDVKEMVAKQDEPWPAPVFTHEDLNPLNILLYGNRVVGLVDWEFAGWHGKMRLPSSSIHTPEELRMEVTRQRYWGDVF
ncbi:hypothetical protein ACRE_089000 [Hapsidospora chrysogenum ATCC 11550]|uniref:Aminoglycoside phosphotransferase domain-containing protein n=1 Tax=Hapsidospora chrysogenum (strain ATCC 11550 / CBS 779.69 / DSM 880 / IAM 14645 / JCM 23072 / IMI 49137) TaxID=857340 RepID=A0A086STK4_HAPC1|nr:hypothetical protein ACRE_089000 [Hapsidospora chrysogenum ATCC 11550]